MKYLLCVLVVLLTGCTDNMMARNFGGSTKVELPSNTKLINATWKQDSLWYLTRPMLEDEKPETLTFKESSSFGVLEGTVMFIEKK